ncbi:MAG TPA: MBL fold metallo-hydrolase [Fimbriimonas sp.]|nr:MBL fold metallo-hydrolase [Fimbriimonas sp.]
MILKRIYNDALAHASYLVGCPGAGEAVIVDPNREIDQYIELAGVEKLKIVAIAETHIHADYLSGARELALRTGATLYLSDEGPPDWKYQFAHEPGVRAVKEGFSFRVGSIRFDVLRTAGHTPEHISFVVTDEASSTAPLGIFSGDFVFVGDVGRPDLLENAAGVADSAGPAAKELYASLQRLLAFPEHLLILPCHGAGSACGKSLGGVPFSSLGYERLSNWALKPINENDFVERVLDGQPDPPKYFAQMKKLNKEGPAILGGVKCPPRLDRSPDGLLIDTRPSEEYLAGHGPSSLHVPLGSSFLKYSGWLVPYGTDLYLLAANEHQALDATSALSLIGLDQVRGWYGPDLLERSELKRNDQIFFSELDAQPDSSVVLDVRTRDEWDEGHIAGAVHIPVGRIVDRHAQIPKGKRIFVHCSSGTRSPMAVSLLERLGFDDVVNIADGYS